MPAFAIEHSPTRYHADFVAYALAIAALSALPQEALDRFDLEVFDISDGEANAPLLYTNPLELEPRQGVETATFVRDLAYGGRTWRMMADAELLAAMLDIANAEEGLDCEGLLAILEPMKVYNRAMTLLRADGMHFSFNRRLEEGEGAAAARETALRDLDEYIGVLVTQPEIRARLAEATADFQRTMDDAGLERQQKLRAMDEDLTRRLAALSEDSHQV